VVAIETNLSELGLVLPEPTKVPQGVVLPFSWVRVHGCRAFVSVSRSTRMETLAAPFGKVGEEVPLEQ
jgi:sarcosine oxidase delta subunit